MGIYLTSDWHLGHEKMAEMRGFSSVEAHDETILRNTKRHVPAGSELYVLGDLAMGERKQRRVLDALWDLQDQCRIDTRVILGNHDRAHPSNKNGHKHGFALGFFPEALHASLRYDGVEFMVSHHPYEGDSGDEDRHVQWRLRDLGAPILHGHTHSREKRSITRYGTVQVHVGLDAWDMKPVSLAEAARVAKGPSGKLLWNVKKGS